MRNIPNIGDLVMADGTLFFVALRTRQVDQSNGNIKQVMLWTGEHREAARAYELSQCQPVDREALLKLQSFKVIVNHHIFQGYVSTVDNESVIRLRVDGKLYPRGIKLPSGEQQFQAAVESFAQAFQGVIIDETEGSTTLAQWQ
jgi:hypothetical protein